MLLHVTPRLITANWGAHGRRLIDVSIPEIGIALREGRDVMARTPYPNKQHLIASAKGRKAQMGLLLDVGEPPEAFTVVTRWEVEGGDVLTHELRLELANRRHEVITACAGDWSMWGSPEWRWDDVHLPWMTVRHTMGLDAYMHEEAGARERQDVVRPARDTVEHGLVVHRHETMQVPTIERERYDWMATQSMGSRSTPPLPVEPVRTVGS